MGQNNQGPAREWLGGVVAIIVKEVLPRTLFAIGEEFLTLGDLSSLNLVQSAH